MPKQANPLSCGLVSVCRPWEINNVGETHGHVKLLASPENGKILGAHIVGPEAAELIHELIAVMYYRGTVHDLARMPHYHPTLAEIITYPAEELAGRINHQDGNHGTHDDRFR